ncbi:MAG: hypothetical protein WAP03_27865 [Methylorubrum rhodinum]|uniref:hypothetical protein n=1 Tax=Methylorubrum rhodinum TaxID=29428 RepID=UPI003BAFAEF0
MKIDIDLNVNVGLTAPAMALVERLLSSVTLPVPSTPAPAVSVSSPASDTASDAVSAAAEEKPASKPRGRPKKAAEIPAPTEPTADEAAQDAEDEAAESAAQAPEADKEVFTLDSVRQAAGAYAQRFGMPAAQADLPAVIGFDKISAVPEGSFEAATLAVRRATAENPKGHAVLGVAA